MEWDRALLQGFRDGAPEALGEVFKRHVDALSRMLRAAAYRGKGFASLRSSLELENTVLEVFARAFEPRARLVYDGVRPYEHFLMGIARNVLLEMGRTREIASGLSPGGEDVFEPMDGSAPPDLHQETEDREVEGLLATFRRGLTPEEEQLFELRFTEGIAQELAAQQLGLSRIQVRRRELQMKKRLLSFLKERGYLRHVESKGWTFLIRRMES